MFINYISFLELLSLKRNLPIESCIDTYELEDMTTTFLTATGNLPIIRWNYLKFTESLIDIITSEIVETTFGSHHNHVLFKFEIIFPATTFQVN